MPKPRKTARKAPKPPRGPVVKLPSHMSFEDAVRHVLKAGPMTKKTARKRTT